jgi:hypothetical protein
MLDVQPGLRILGSGGLMSAKPLNSGAKPDIAGGPGGANKRHYSITSSARPSSIAGISRPSAFAALRLIHQFESGGRKVWNIVGFGAFQDLVSHIGDAVSGRQSATCFASRSKGARAVT